MDIVKEGLKLKGHWIIDIKENGKLIRRIERDNQLTIGYRDAILHQLKGDLFTSLDILYLAVGTGDTPAQASDTHLATEIFRSMPTQKSIIGNYLQTIWVIPPDSANAYIREIGVFAGDATTTPDSGTMISRINLNIEKTESMEITFIRRDYVLI